MASVAQAEPVARVARGQQKSRRDVIETTLKEFEERTQEDQACRSRCASRRPA